MMLAWLLEWGMFVIIAVGFGGILLLLIIHAMMGGPDDGA